MGLSYAKIAAIALQCGFSLTASRRLPPVADTESLSAFLDACRDAEKPVSRDVLSQEEVESLLAALEPAGPTEAEVAELIAGVLENPSHRFRAAAVARALMERFDVRSR